MEYTKLYKGQAIVNEEAYRFLKLSETNNKIILHGELKKFFDRQKTTNKEGASFKIYDQIKSAINKLVFSIDTDVDADTLIDSIYPKGDFLTKIALKTALNLQISKFNNLSDGERDQQKKEIADEFYQIVINFEWNLEIEVVNYVQSSVGSWPEDIGHVVYMDKSSLPELQKQLIDQFAKTVQSKSKSPLALFFRTDMISSSVGLNFEEYAITSLAKLRNRGHVYQTEASVKSAILNFTNLFYKTMGFTYGVQIQDFLPYNMQNVIKLNQFLGSMFDACIYLLILIAFFLLYAVFLQDIDTKTYEMSILRILGIKKEWVLVMLSFKTVIYSIPGWYFGQLLAQLLKNIIVYHIFSFVMEYYEIGFLRVQVLTLIVIGLALPFVINLFSLRKVFKKTLKDSLNHLSRKIDDSTIIQKKLEMMGVSFTTLCIAIYLIIFGYISYYEMPRTLIYKDMTSFLFCLNLVFFFMVIGVVLIFNIFQKPIEDILIKLFLKVVCKKQKNLIQVVKNNQILHKRKMNKVSFTLTLIFVFMIFFTSVIQLQSSNINDIMKMIIGTDLRVQFSYNIFLQRSYESLNITGINAFLTSYHEKYPNNIQDWSFLYSTTKELDLNDLNLLTGKERPKAKINLFCVDQNLLNSTYIDFYVPAKYDSNIDFKKFDSKVDFTSGLYQEDGKSRGKFKKEDIIGHIDPYSVMAGNRQQDSNKIQRLEQDLIDKEDQEILIVTPSAYRRAFGIDFDTVLQIENDSGFSLRARSIMEIQNFPGNILISDDATVAAVAPTPVIISCQQYKYLLNRLVKHKQFLNYKEWLISSRSRTPQTDTKYGLQSNTLYIKFARHLEKTERQEIEMGLRGVNEQEIIFIDTNKGIESNQNAMLILDTFKFLTSSVLIILSSLLMVVIFKSNIQQNLYQIKVLRAIGLNNNQLFAVYLYESFALIFSVTIIGTSIGWVMSQIISIELSTLVRLPVQNILFPWSTAICNIYIQVLIISSSLSAYFGQKIAFKKIKNSSIANITR